MFISTIMEEEIKEVTKKEKIFYLAPINKYNNHVFRHLILNHGADYVFTEMIHAEYLGEENTRLRIKTFPEDIEKTIYQIAAGTETEIARTINLIYSELEKQDGKPIEINLNMGCPSSSMQDKKICGGILFNIDHMKKLSHALSYHANQKKFVPSAKLRLGLNQKTILIKEYLTVLKESGIRKVYIHARTLRQSYEKPANYQPLRRIKKEFPDMEIILNGDIFSFASYWEVNRIQNDGVMIGRAAIYNPLIFEQIKAGVQPRKGEGNPVHQDPGLRNKGSFIVLGEEKRNVIKEYLDIAKSEKLDVEMMRRNIVLFLKGISHYKKITNEMHEVTNRSKMISIIEASLYP
jgi:tRNA-dihydrouridine synthase B